MGTTTDTTNDAVAAAEAALDAFSDALPEPGEAAPDVVAKQSEQADTEPEQAEKDWLDDAEVDYDLKLKFGESPVTLREMREAYESRTAPQIIEAERQAIAKQQQALEAERAKYEYTTFEAVPHKFLTASLQRMVQAGHLPVELYQGIKSVFEQAIEQGLYSPDKAEQRAAELAKHSELEREKETLDTKIRTAQMEVQIAQVIARNPELANPDRSTLKPEVATKIMDYVRAQVAKTGELPTISEAANALLKAGALTAPQKTRKQVADSFRKKAPAVTAQKGGKPTRDAALQAFYN
jgi:hypothetical protein